jgi:hypothetical protein
MEKKTYVRGCATYARLPLPPLLGGVAPSFRLASSVVAPTYHGPIRAPKAASPMKLSAAGACMRDDRHLSCVNTSYLLQFFIYLCVMQNLWLVFEKTIDITTHIRHPHLSQLMLVRKTIDIATRIRHPHLSQLMLVPSLQ